MKLAKTSQDAPLAVSPVAASPVAYDHTNMVAARPRPRPTLPSTYGESHILLLARDPQTLFAAWDMSPIAVTALRSRVGARAFAVSSLTLRLIPARGRTTTYHASKKARSRYIKIDGGSPSFIVEIGFSTPAGQFEMIARSVRCAVPVGPGARKDWPATARRAVLGYRDARIAAKRNLVIHAGASGSPHGTTRVRSVQTASAPHQPAGASALPRILGGASDLYRR